MKNQLVTVCVFCLLCAAHSHCSSHGESMLTIHDGPHSAKLGNGHLYNDGGGGSGIGGGGGGLQSSGLVLDENGNKGSAVDDNKLESNVFISRVFKKFGNGETISRDGFENLLRALGLNHLVDHPNANPNPSLHILHSDHNSNRTDNVTGHSNDQTLHVHAGSACISSDDLLGAKNSLSKDLYKSICPALLYQYISQTSCSGDSTDVHSHSSLEQTKNTYLVWMYATVSIIVISLCGLGGVVVIPVMQKVFYQKLLQFLVALAVGTLCGDALLHLLPHAMLPKHSHSHSVSNLHCDTCQVDDTHDTNMWRGLVAMFGIISFYFTEKGLTFIADWRKRKQRKKQALPRVRVMRGVEGTGLVSKTTPVGEKLCKHKYSSYPYCYGEIADSAEGQKNVIDSRDGTDLKNSTEKSGREENGSLTNAKQYSYIKNDKVNGADLAVERELLNAEKESDVNESHANEESFTIIIREHESAHHGHSHQHGHVHAAPTSLSSVAWMVIMGDGLHNFADGMAIGAAFATNIPGGFSTALAVLFHELPHELGDFAVLLQAGMSAKQAVFYNLLSSILCFVGMCLGVFLGHDESTTQWVFSAAAGMFLYIALVDMIPELTSSHSKEEGLFCQCFLHFAGLMSGVGTMLLIALYEQNLKSFFVQ